MYQKLKTIAFVSALSILAVACEKKDDPIVDPPPPPANTTQEMHINFKNYVGDDALTLNTAEYTNASNEKFKVTTFNYYITNIKFKTKDGKEFAEPESYHLVKGDILASGHLHVKNVPLGEYTSMSYMVGVDSFRNTDGAQTGALDPLQGMFWTWNTGYIMAKLEGTSPASPATDQKFVQHIGGFKGINTGIRRVTLNFPQGINVVSGVNGDVEIKADIQKWFSNPNNISIAKVNNLMNPNQDSKMIADNYATMFSITKATTTTD